MLGLYRIRRTEAHQPGTHLFSLSIRLILNFFYGAQESRGPNYLKVRNFYDINTRIRIFLFFDLK